MSEFLIHIFGLLLGTCAGPGTHIALVRDREQLWRFIKGLAGFKIVALSFAVRQKMSDALRKALNITARLNGSLVGCVCFLSDGYTFGTIPDLFALPEHQKKGIGTRLLELVKVNTPTQLFLGAQPGKEDFYKRLGFKPDLRSFRYRRQKNS